MMIQTLTKIVGVQNIILDVDRQAGQCLTMVCALWVLLTLSTAYSAYLSAKDILVAYSVFLSYSIAITSGLAVLFALYALYRRMICLALFPSGRYTLRIIGCELLICLITVFTWLPNMISNLAGDLPSLFSLSDIIALNHAGFSFMILCMTLILIINVISVYALCISCNRHLMISNSVYSI